jgi:hypothetical protein
MMHTKRTPRPAPTPMPASAAVERLLRVGASVEDDDDGTEVIVEAVVEAVEEPPLEEVMVAFDEAELVPDVVELVKLLRLLELAELITAVELGEVVELAE